MRDQPREIEPRESESHCCWRMLMRAKKKGAVGITLVLVALQKEKKKREEEKEARSLDAHTTWLMYSRQVSLCEICALEHLRTPHSK